MNYKELAFSYFRGDIAEEDERELNAWVKEDDRNAAQLREWEKERGFLRETCLAAQDRFRAWMDYFELH